MQGVGYGDERGIIPRAMKQIMDSAADLALQVTICTEFFMETRPAKFLTHVPGLGVQPGGHVCGSLQRKYIRPLRGLAGTYKPVCTHTTCRDIGGARRRVADPPRRQGQHAPTRRRPPARGLRGGRARADGGGATQTPRGLHLHECSFFAQPRRLQPFPHWPQRTGGHNPERVVKSCGSRRVGEAGPQVSSLHNIIIIRIM